MVLFASRITRGAFARAHVIVNCRFMSSKSIIPVIDVSKPKEEVAREIGRACEEIGFLSIVNHGVPKPLMDNFWNETINYFDLPAAEKKQIPMTEKYPYGYSGFQEENLSAGYGEETRPDLKECFAIGNHNPAAGLEPVKWPVGHPKFKQAWQDYYGEMEQLSSRMLGLFALSLDLPENWFEGKMQRHRSALRALNYPELTTAPVEGQIRAGAHTDYGTITILKQDGTGGLQVRDRAMQWHDVPCQPDSFVINLGDLMPRWTNEKWVSTLHRVVNPKDYKGNRRQSVAYFHNIDHDHLVECIPTCTDAENPPKYEPILFWDHLMEKHLASTGGKK